MRDTVSNIGHGTKPPQPKKITAAAALEFDLDQLGVEHDFGVVGEEF
jgi:hypothetical protein